MVLSILTPKCPKLFLKSSLNTKFPYFFGPNNGEHLTTSSNPYAGICGSIRVTKLGYAMSWRRFVSLQKTGHGHLVSGHDSWEQAAGHSKRPSMNKGQPLASWPGRLGRSKNVVFPKAFWQFLCGILVQTYEYPTSKYIKMEYVGANCPAWLKSISWQPTKSTCVLGAASVNVMIPHVQMIQLNTDIQVSTIMKR